MTLRFVSSLIAVGMALLFTFSAPALAECPEDTVNLNSATVEMLQEVNGIGSTLAQRIVDYRQEQPFTSKQEITEIKGIGSKSFEKMKDSICVD